MAPSHPLTQRQIRKHLGGTVPEPLTALVDAVDEAYGQFDADRKLLERSLELSSKELGEANASLYAKQTELEANLSRIQQMQEQLIAQEKLASLGGLTAGIAHEIKNPLNFVNNFADLSQELAEELLALVDQEGPLDRDEARDLCKLLQDNVTKIASHGKRADGIVRAMLLHSRGKAGDMVESNINTVVDEHCTLAYHGLRARDASVRVDVERHLSEAVKPFLFAPQDMARVILNLVGNACEAAWERARGDDAHPAKVTVRTEPWEKGVRITVRDNGPGVPLDLQKKIFEPFFTTKPPGVGTGLGLSISFDILRAHGGELRLESVPGDYAEFQVYLPYEGASAPMGQR